MSQAFTISVTSSRPPGATPAVLAALLPIIAVVFIAFLVIGLALPVLPLHVRQGLGLGTFVVGLVAGAQLAASLLSQLMADSWCLKEATPSNAVFDGVVPSRNTPPFLSTLKSVEQRQGGSLWIRYEVARP